MYFLSNEVELGWKLEHLAANDLTPMSGAIRFEPKALTKNISIHTIPDNYLEGKELYKLMITYATGDAEVSPSANHCFVCLFKRNQLKCYSLILMVKFNEKNKLIYINIFIQYSV